MHTWPVYTRLIAVDSYCDELVWGWLGWVDSERVSITMVSSCEPMCDTKASYTTSICPNCSKCRTYLTGSTSWWSLPSPLAIMYLTTIISCGISCFSLYKVTSSVTRRTNQENSDWFRYQLFLYSSDTTLFWTLHINPLYPRLILD